MANTQTEDESVKELMEGVIADINRQGYKAIENEDIEGFYSLVVRQAEEVKNLLQTTDTPVPTAISAKKTDDVVVEEKKLEIVFDHEVYSKPIQISVLDKLYPDMDKSFKEHLNTNNVPFSSVEHMNAFMKNTNAMYESAKTDIRDVNNAVQLIRMVLLNGGRVTEKQVYETFFGTDTPTDYEEQALKSVMSKIRDRTRKCGDKKSTSKKSMSTDWPVMIDISRANNKAAVPVPRYYNVDSNLVMWLHAIDADQF